MITLFYYTKRKRSFRIKVMISMQKLRRGWWIYLGFASINTGGARRLLMSN
jgi:Uri superfamily endonuclease